MSELPFEILRLISQLLWKDDLLEFQLVNKRWREASTESLYQHVTISDVRQELAYIRTISNSHKLGSYLKNINVVSAFSSIENSTIWDKNNLLELIIRYCSNLRGIRSYHPHHLLWTRLIVAANQGHLPNLERLPKMDDGNIQSYVYTALAFKNSLNSLDLVDYIGISCDPLRRKRNIKAFQELSEHIKEFPNLKDLTIKHCTNQPFSHIVDALVDKCPQLKTLYVTLNKSHSEATTTQNILAIPKPNICRLQCDWTMIYKDEELEYLMRKFPNLQDLYVYGGFTLGSSDMTLEAYDTSYGTMMEFIKYITSIKKVNLHFACKQRYMVDYWSALKKSPRGKVLEQASIHYHLSEVNSIGSMDFSDDRAALTYVINNNSDSIPHEELLCKHGDGFKRLSISNTSSVVKRLFNRSSMWRTLSCENWIYQILRYCPSLQELELEDLVEFKLPGNSTYQHTELKRLKIAETFGVASPKFLKYFSFHVPNLKILEIKNDRNNEDNEDYCIEIEMPYTMFDLISIYFNEVADRLEDYYIKLNTIVEEKYYFVNSTGRRNLTFNQYQKSNKHYLLKITCRGLKQLNLSRINSDDMGDEYLVSQQIF